MTTPGRPPAPGSDPAIRPAPSPIADAAAAAHDRWAQSEARYTSLIAAARKALAPILPGVQLEGLATYVEDGDLVRVTDGLVTLGVLTDGSVWTIRSAGGKWTQGRQVRNGRELAEALPPEVMQGRVTRG